MYAQIVILLIGFSSFVGISIVIPVLPHYATAFGASALGVTFAFAITPGIAMVSGIVWGRASDRFGRRPIVIISLVGQFASFLWLAYATSLTEIYLSRAIAGVFVGSIPALFASMTDITSPEKRAGAMGRVSASLTAGFMVGPVLGGILATAFTDEPSFFYPFIITAALYGVLIVVATFALPESRTRAARQQLATARQSFAQRLRVYMAPLMSVPLLGVATVHFSSSSTSAILALWVLDRFGWGVAETSWVVTTMAALVMLWNLGAASLTGWFGHTPVLLASQLGVVLAFLSFVFVQQPAVVYLILVLAAFGNGLGRTVTTALVSLGAEEDRRGEAMGVQNTVASAVTAGGPLLAGWLFVAISPSAPFVVIAAFAVVAFGATALFLAFGTDRERETLL